mmetsp:Transcript_9488/g.25576  ORF Transcript_9488/g.25576 Transcript_9488/m.25576 type:complete len:249 (-) Transcript_9488:842-1588(-)
MPLDAWGVHRRRLVLLSRKLCMARMGSDAEKGEAPASSCTVLICASSPSCCKRPMASASSGSGMDPGGGAMRVPGGSSTASLWSDHKELRRGSRASPASSALLAKIMARAGTESSPNSSRSWRNMRVSTASFRPGSTTMYWCVRPVGSAWSFPTWMVMGSFIHPAWTARSAVDGSTVAPTAIICGFVALFRVAMLRSTNIASGAVSKHSSYSSMATTRTWLSRGMASFPPTQSSSAVGVATTTWTPRR